MKEAVDADRIDSLPERPLTLSEADHLTDSGEFVPLTIKSELVDEIPYSENTTEKDIAENSEYFVYSLLHATEEKGVSIAYSELHGFWVEAVVMSDAENYDAEQMEEQTHQFVKEHSQSNIDVDAGLVNVDEAIEGSDDAE